VLLVEDEALIRMDAADAIRDLGFDVIEAASADDAIAVLERTADIAVVFTDIQMPGSMDGLRLAAAVRDRWPPVAIIVTSGQVRPHEHDLPTKVPFLAKPYGSHQLKHHLEALTSS
jgi:CheY-like chemotaxis protein